MFCGYKLTELPRNQQKKKKKSLAGLGCVLMTNTDLIKMFYSKVISALQATNKPMIVNHKGENLKTYRQIKPHTA